MRQLCLLACSVTGKHLIQPVVLVVVDLFGYSQLAVSHCSDCAFCVLQHRLPQLLASMVCLGTCKQRFVIAAAQLTGPLAALQSAVPLSSISDLVVVNRAGWEMDIICYKLELLDASSALLRTFTLWPALRVFSLLSADTCYRQPPAAPPPSGCCTDAGGAC